MLRLLLAAALIALTPAAHAADCIANATQMEDNNKKVVAEFYEAAVNQKDFEAAASFLGPRYIQHNPNAADGPEGLKAFDWEGYRFIEGRSDPLNYVFIQERNYI